VRLATATAADTQDAERKMLQHPALHGWGQLQLSNVDGWLRVQQNFCYINGPPEF
jgi:hypothetical protein